MSDFDGKEISLIVFAFHSLNTKKHLKTLFIMTRYNSCK